MKSRKVIFYNNWIRVVQLDDWFFASEQVQSKNNMAVAVLPYRKVKIKNDTINIKEAGNETYKHEFLSRFELNPAHMTDLLHQSSIITGACETGNPLYHAKMELLEEGGYDIPEKRFKFMGIVSPMKASCSRLHLYTVRIYQKDKQKQTKGDGSIHEKREYASWVDRKTMIACKDPYVHTIMMRAEL